MGIVRVIKVVNRQKKLVEFSLIKIEYYYIANTLNQSLILSVGTVKVFHRLTNEDFCSVTRFKDLSPVRQNLLLMLRFISLYKFSSLKTLAWLPVSGGTLERCLVTIPFLKG